MISDIQVFIVEDEIAVRRSLKGKIPWDQRGLKLMGEAQNAEEAYEIIKNSPPDIVLLDMRMPGMGGIKFLDILKEQFPKSKVIILSGYSDFEYVKHALKCGASDYLLKPVIKDELNKALFNAIDSIELIQHQKDEALKQDMLLHQSIPLLKRSLLNTLLQGTYLDAAEVIKRLALLDVRLNDNYFALAIVNIIDYERIKTHYRHNTALLFFAVENVIMESSVHDLIGFKSEVRENEYLCLLGFQGRDGIRKRLEDLFKKTIPNIERFNKIRINISVGRVFDAITDLRSVYSETSYIWQQKHDHTTSSILFSEDVELSKDDTEEQLLSGEEAKELSAFMEQNDLRSITVMINKLFARIGNRPDSMPAHRRLAAEIYRVFESHIQQAALFADAQPLLEVPAYNELMSKYETQDDIKLGMIVLIDEVIRRMKTSGGKTKKIIEKAKEYVEHYFYEELTLDLVANKFFINRTYFSELFKEETGSTFKKYLNQIRIEKAKELMSEKDMKAVNVATLVGFKDPVYFTTVFKKYTGLSIKEYVDKHQTYDRILAQGSTVEG